MELVETPNCKVCMCENNEVKHKLKSSNEPLSSKEVNTTCAWIQEQKCNDPAKQMCFKCLCFKQNEIKIKTEIEELDIEEAEILCKTEEVSLKKEFASHELEGSFTNCESTFSDRVKIECNYTDLEDPLHIDTNYDKFPSSCTKENTIKKEISNEELGLLEKPSKLSKLFNCKFCNKQLRTKHNLIQHVRVHSREKPYKCDICNKQFSHLSSLKTHKQIHTGQKRFKCDICDAQFTKAIDLKCHKQIFVCYKDFYNSGDLKKHHKTQMSKKAYKCDICNRQFSLSGNLKVHRQLHEEEKPYKCEVCNRNFHTSKYLKSHQIKHTQERVYKCDVCSKTFFIFDVLKEHMKTHTGEKPHKCDVCFKDFCTVGDLKRHMISHTREKSFKCDICHRQFNKLFNLKRHKQYAAVCVPKQATPNDKI